MTVEVGLLLSQPEVGPWVSCFQMTAQINRCARQCLRLMLDHCSDHRSMEVKEYVACHPLYMLRAAKGIQGW